MIYRAAKPMGNLPVLTPEKSTVIHNLLNKSLRYPSLVGKDWETLPSSIQRRFVKWTPTRHQHIYYGRVLETRINFLGFILANICRLIGGPLPLTPNAKGPAAVIVREAHAFNGQIWTRFYGRDNRPPQVIHSVKRFTGPTGLEEMVSPYLGIALIVGVQSGCLSFTSKNYFIKLFHYRLPLPKWIEPGTMHVTHRENGPKHFRFTLELTHSLFGNLIYQTAIFKDNQQ